MMLLSSANAKTLLGERLGFQTFSLMLAPAEEAGGRTVCPWSSPGCREACVYRVGRGPMPNVIRARVGRTRWLHGDREGFLAQIGDDVSEAVEKAEAANLDPCFRLNCFSDVPWELERYLGVDFFAKWGSCWFYDYTKSPERAIMSATDPRWPENYHLTFSLSENNLDDALKVLKAGCPVAVPFRVKRVEDLPHRFMGLKVVDGDSHDLTFLHGPGPYILGLTAKGRRAWEDKTGFIQDLPTT